MSDLWKFDGSAWTWVAGSDLVDTPTKYENTDGNDPGGRQNAVGK